MKLYLPNFICLNDSTPCFALSTVSDFILTDKFVVVISAPLLRAVLSPSTRLDLVFVKSFSFNLLSDFPYPIERPPLPILPLNPFFFSSSEYELWSSLESVVNFPPIKLLSPKTKLLPIRFTSPLIGPLPST